MMGHGDRTDFSIIGPAEIVLGMLEEMKIEFPKRVGSPYQQTSYQLYRMLSRHLDGQIVLVGRSGQDFAFTFHDELDRHLITERDWVCIGELQWRVEGDKFVYDLMPLQIRGERELIERAVKTQAHREYRQRLWKSYRIGERFMDLSRTHPGVHQTACFRQYNCTSRRGFEPLEAHPIIASVLP
jgi:hypothetical protein